MANDRWPPHVITVPSLFHGAPLIAAQFVPEQRRGFIEVPIVRDLRDLDEAAVYLQAGKFAGDVLASLSTVAPGLSTFTTTIRNAWVAGHLSRLVSEKRARCPIGQDQLGALVNVMSGWPLRDR
jgi:hypothetical protein